MIFRFDGGQRDRLLEQPESGMGYQLADADPFVFLNAEIAIGLDDNDEMLGGDVKWLSKFLLQDDDARQEMLDDLKPYAHGIQITAHRSYPSSTYPSEIFWRYSAFRHDRRIRSDQSVLPGTYVTTENDSRHVSSGLGAVGRYALPNPISTRFATEIRSPSGQSILCGNSVPKFGQAGGGVEILLIQSLPPNSVANQRQIPER